MDLIHFEELIDLGTNISLINTDQQNENGSQKSSQEPLADLLDKMCAAMVENDLVVADPLNNNIDEAKIDIAVDFEEPEEMCEATVGRLGSNLALDDPMKHDTDEVERYTVINLDDFEQILAATYISNNCTNIDETGNIVDNKIANTALKEIIKPVMPYDLPINFEEIAETIAECASLDEDKKLISSLNSALEPHLHAVNVADNEIENEYNLETAKLKEIGIRFNEDILNIDEFINDCCDEVEENVSIIGNTSNTKRTNTSLDSNIDKIIISSDSDDDYHSSDFEFITEDEANKDGIVLKTKITFKKSMQGDIAPHAAPCTTNKPTSNPHRNEASPSEYIKYSKYRYQHCYAELSSEYHVIPEGEQYLDMFQGQFAPAIVNNLHVMTNKSVLPTTPMSAMFDDLGFRFGDQDLEEEHAQYKEEAEECAKKIRSMYPNENRKRRRRF